MTKKLKRESTTGKKLVLSLQDNAFDSLTHAVEHFIDTQHPNYLKYAVVHTFHAIELFLKARLSKEHESLIFEKPEEMGKEGAKTVSFTTLLKRLRAVRVDIPGYQIRVLEDLQRVRNQIEHFQIEKPKADVGKFLAEAMLFIEPFIKHSFGVSLRDSLSRPTYETLDQQVAQHVKKLKESEGKLRRTLEELKLDDGSVFVCPFCQKERVIQAKNGTASVCLFCKRTCYFIKCDSCGKALVTKEDPQAAAEYGYREFCAGCEDKLFPAPEDLN